MIRLTKISAAVVVALATAGCGTSTGDRVVSGAGLGAAGGAIIGAMTGNPGAGAAIGAAGGALIGGVTDPCDLDLGTPYWRDHGGRDEYDRRCGDDDRYRDRDRNRDRDRD